MTAVPAHHFYYLNNFQQALDWIGQRYADLLVEEELDFMARFPTLPRPARALFVRLVMRKGELFRTSRLDYPEIGCPASAARALPEAWITHDPVLSLDELAGLLVKPELGRTFALPTALRSARKPEQVEALRRDPAHGQARPFSHWIGHANDAALRLRVRPLCDRLRLVFFGNLNQDWSEFVLSDLGTFRYERVDFSADSRGFRHRADLDHYLRLHDCRERYHAGEPAADILPALVDALPAGGVGNPWLEHRRQRLMFQLGQSFEKDKDWDQAYAVYAACRHPGARGRAIRVLEKHQKFEQAFALLCAARAAPENEAERQQLLRIAPRLARRLGHAPQAKPGPAPAERLDLCLPEGSGLRVEGAVASHLQRDDAPVFYVENTLANSLFGLLCWQAVFAAVPGAFFHPFHRGPADLYSADFQDRRREQFDRCLALLEHDGYRDAILHTYDQKHGLQSPFVHWQYIGRDLVELALDCIPAAHLKLWCLRILQDIRENRSGFPDLIQFWPQQRRYRMIEVKGPGDRLQDNQLRWLDYCARHAMPVAVCYLQWQRAAA
ncbi:VRR-NUC domain-containing protein [Herbaspirillum sp. YR522]|uniref:VRR-NUC domain-containing protein n=1 Tax=Herbaspirillum sp. YR522 TaxID=1144342 RepID=UPI00026FC53D|nr:VRR-NUC domain-containing protein [Herbaspirillum sp. YR522]EJM97629.1 VRR-NUC domain-containing protein [Herbaspirillum sp. YR522]